MLLERLFVGVDLVAVSAHELEVVEFVALLLVRVRVRKVGHAGILER